jgi:hypothetical protein
VGGRCSCRAASAANLIRNPGFDQDIAGWTMLDDGKVVWVREDAADCSSSGGLSMQASPAGMVTMVRQCVPIQAGVTYNFGAWVREPDQSDPTYTQATMTVQFFAAPDCPFLGTSTNGGWDVLRIARDWNHTTGTTTAPPGAASASVVLGTLSSSLEIFDYVYLTPAPGDF